LNVDREDRSSNLNGNVYADVKFNGFLKGLKIQLNIGTNYITTRFGSYTGRIANNTIGGASISNSETTNWVVENILTYNKDINLHHFDFTGLYSSQQRNYFKSATDGSGFINDELSFKNMGAAATVSAGYITDQIRGPYQDKYSLASQMARIKLFL
jgi:hypothetical protein